MNRKGILALVLIALMAGMLSGCSMIKKESQVAADVPNPIVTIEMTSGKTMKLELYPQIALNTVSNFVTLAQEGYYDGLIFHRIIAGFMIQGGDPTGTGTGGPGYSIKGEFTENGFQNDLKHTPGVISMARSGDPDSAGSQFFIVHATAESLDGKYAAFGKIIDEESMDTLNEIATVKTDGSDRPLIEQKIKSITVDTGGYQYQVVKAP